MWKIFCTNFNVIYSYISVSYQPKNSIGLNMYYHSLGSVFTLTKRIILFYFKWNSSLNFENIYISIISYNIVIWVMKSFKMWHMIIMMLFNMSNFIFSQIFISLFWGLFNDKTDLRVRYSRIKLVWKMLKGAHTSCLPKPDWYVQKLTPDQHYKKGPKKK
jgi:hypothetical protein